MVWNKAEIIRTLRRLYKEGADLSYNALAAKKQALVSAAAYHFGSYRRAVEKAGVDYDSVVRRPRWTKAMIIKLIKGAKREGDNLHWSAVTGRRDELGKAAFASLQPRLFGSWARALTAAGLDADEVSRYRRWDKEMIVFELRSRFRSHEPMNSGALQSNDPGLHAAAVRHFQSYDGALRAARLDPVALRERRRWTKPDILRALKAAGQDGRRLTGSSLREEQPALYGAAVRVFGNFAAARNAAKISMRKPKK